MAHEKLSVELQGWVGFLAGALHARVRHRFAAIFVGIVFAVGRRTVSRWIVASGASRDWRRHYYFRGNIGRKADQASLCLMATVRREFPPGGHVLFVIDDSPTKRCGPKIEGAGFHHNPTPGPASEELLYGHSWVTPGRAVRHPEHGMIGLPPAAKLNVREKDLSKIPPWSRPSFQTKLELAGELLKTACRFGRDRDDVVWAAPGRRRSPATPRAAGQPSAAAAPAGSAPRRAGTAGRGWPGSGGR